MEFTRDIKVSPDLGKKIAKCNKQKFGVVKFVYCKRSSKR